MADVKISGLPASIVPLAGIEVLPIVQGTTTKQVSIANVTAGRAVSAASLALTTSPLPITSGGTNATATPTAGGVPYGTGTAFAFTAAGTAGQVLSSNTASAPSWITLPPVVGSVIQVVNASYSTQTTSSTSTYVDTGLTATITPKFATSKILVCVSQVGLGKDSSNTTIALRLLRNASSIFVFEQYAAATGSLLTNYVAGTSVTYLDNPATTSATVYKTQFNSQSNSAIVYVQGNTCTSTITLMEIAQ